MDYTIHKLAQMAGISSRTLRHYDSIGLLRPAGVNSSGYRMYTRREVDLLQQILFYRELGMGLTDIKGILHNPAFDHTQALSGHLQALTAERARLDALIANVRRTLEEQRGGKNMSDKEKFEGFKRGLIDENERKYGAEIRQKYGDKTVDESNTKLMGMSQAEYADTEQLTKRVNDAIKAAFETSDPKGPLAMEACALHKEWLMRYWGSYSKEAHRGLGQMYVDDERFAAYYDAIAPGCAVFLRDALEAYCAE